MRYFDFLSREKLEDLFFIPPGDFDKFSKKEILQHALGALLYYPAIKNGLLNFIRTNVNLKSIVFCLEDAIGDNQVAQAQKTLLVQLKDLKKLYASGEISFLPLMFLRVRSPQHLNEILQEFSEILDLLTGFVFPKFDTKVAESYFKIFNRTKQHCSTPLYACPTLEGAEIIEREKRLDSLKCIKEVLDENRESVLNIRLGSTDFLGLFRMRRDVNYTIYDISIMKDCIGDIVNFFCRRNSPYVVSGGVWEFFPERETRDKTMAVNLLNHPAQKKLIEEVKLDMINGLWGKTAIHPSQLFPIQASHIMTFEDYHDALDVVSDEGLVNGASSSQFSNKMNEYKPHQYWASKILTRARIFGVLKKDINYEQLFM
ncbi:MAG: HpcH/HpaI aldolase/citrate lyase family protein [Bacteroidales bacterium]|nr:HpcH/HpaI aldolase/citrate lyase family protein [Bacteroidales bacterium]